MSVRILVALVTLGVAASALADAPRPRPHVVRVEHRAAEDNPSLGPAGAPVTAELFLVPGQNESNRAYRRVVELQARHPQRLRVVFRVITRSAQQVVPLAALEAHAQGRFHEFMAELLTSRTGTIKKDDLPAYASRAGVDPIRLARALDRAEDPDLVPVVLRANERRWWRRGANVPELLFNGARVGAPLQSLDVDELEPYYVAAYEQAQQLLADGVPPERLVEAAERAAAPRWAITEWEAGPIDDAELGWEPPPGPPPLLARPLDTAGLPAVGGVDAPVQIVVACNLLYPSCRTQLAMARRLHELYPDEVRLVWHPWFDQDVEGSEDAPALHTAALCAEEQEVGWRWVEETGHQMMRTRDPELEEVIAKVTDLVEVDRAALTRCRARREADAVARQVAAAVAAGVDRAPAWVINGRVFLGGFTDVRGAAPVVDAELAPGLLERLVPSW